MRLFRLETYWEAECLEVSRLRPSLSTILLYSPNKNQFFCAITSNVHYRHKTDYLLGNKSLMPLRAATLFKNRKKKTNYICKRYMIFTPRKVISVNHVLNRLNPGIKFILRRITKFVEENEKLSATNSRSRQNLVWQTMRHLCAAQLLTPRSTNHINDLWRCRSSCSALPIANY